MVTSQGALCPVLALNGSRRASTLNSAKIREGFAQAGLVLVDDPLVIEPFLYGRETGLRPRKGDRLFAFFAGLFGTIQLLFAILKPIGRHRRAAWEEGRRAKAAEQAQTD